ncbi:TetR family transcriptional regulator [Actinomycetospora sp. CA-084318]|uniref:TetR/AcrR family transcriptional regulator n=1 Tax=Actinomycetospora sp. CA-084318 TaxID=3239892 RepID=UPI003D993299
MADGVKPTRGGKPPSRDGRRTRWTKHREERRAEFVEAAMRVLAEVGPEFGIEQVAIEAGVTKPVLYRHFSDKADLVEAMGERGTHILLDRLIPALNSEEAPLPRIRKSIDAVLGTLEDYPNLYWVLARHGHGQEVVQADKEIIATALSALLGDYLRAFGLDSGAAEPWAYGVVGLVQNTAEWWLERRSMSRDSVTEYLTMLVWAAIDGFARQRDVVIDPNVPLEINKVIQMSPGGSSGSSESDVAEAGNGER